MDRDEKIAGLKAWLDEYDKRQKQVSITRRLKDSLTDDIRGHRTVLAVLRKLKDEKVMERLGIFAMKG